MTTETTLKEKRAKAVQKLSAGAELLRKLAKPAVAFLTYSIPLCIVNGRRIREAYYALPSNMLQFQLGLIFCFFGGLYPVLFAAFQVSLVMGVCMCVCALYLIVDTSIMAAGNSIITIKDTITVLVDSIVYISSHSHVLCYYSPHQIGRTTLS